MITFLTEAEKKPMMQYGNCQCYCTDTNKQKTNEMLYNTNALCLKIMKCLLSLKMITINVSTNYLYETHN